jgi:RNA polymerase-binding protein DksA
MASERDRLEKERVETLAELERLRAYLEYEPEHGGDEADLDVYEREKNLALIQALERKLQAINKALRTAEKGTYGVCERCGEKIDPARLKVLPHTTLCVKCKTTLEKMGKRGIRAPTY